MNLIIEDKIKVKAVPCEIYSRVSGYFRPVSQWNGAKREEFSERRFAHITNEYLEGKNGKRSY